MLGKKEDKKKSHIESQSQYFGKKSQLDYFPKSFSPRENGKIKTCVIQESLTERAVQSVTSVKGRDGEADFQTITSPSIHVPDTLGQGNLQCREDILSIRGKRTVKERHGEREECRQWGQG